MKSFEYARAHVNATMIGEDKIRALHVITGNQQHHAVVSSLLDTFRGLLTHNAVSATRNDNERSGLTHVTVSTAFLQRILEAKL